MAIQRRPLPDVPEPGVSRPVPCTSIGNSSIAQTYIDSSDILQSRIEAGPTTEGGGGYVKFELATRNSESSPSHSTLDSSSDDGDPIYSEPYSNRILTTTSQGIMHETRTDINFYVLCLYTLESAKGS